MGVPSWLSLTFLKPGPELDFGFFMFDDPREKALRDAVHRATRRHSG